MTGSCDSKEEDLRQIEQFIAGGAAGAASTRFADVFDPNTGQIQARVAFSSMADLDSAMAKAQAAQPGWAATNPQRRARVMFNFKALLEANMQSLAELLAG